MNRPFFVCGLSRAIRESPLQPILGRELVFSADLCYNEVNEKAFLREEGGTRSVTEGARVTLGMC